MNNFVFKIKKDFRFHYQKKKFFRNNIAWQLSIDTSQDLIIKPGFVAVLGESGTGKSTLISIMGGFEHLDKEQAQYISYCHNGKEINYADKSISSIKKKEFGYIFQRCYESKSLNAIDNITMPLVNGNYCAKTAKHYCNQLLESLGLNNLKSSSANELSGGQLTRIGILRGIAQTPTVLFADEPANNLDEQNAGQILDILQQWQQHTNGTVIMVTHHRKHAFKYADQLIVFQSDNSGSGKIVFYKESEQKQCHTDKWTDSEIKTIEQMLLINHNNQLEFPEPPEPEKNCITNRIGFLIKTAWQNNVSKADGSRTISLITLSAFVLLFFTIFAGTLLLKWFHQVDQIKNNDAFLRRFDIKVLEDPGLSKELQDNINNIRVIDIQRWLISKIDDDINQLNKQCSAFVQTYSFAKLPEIMAQQFNALSDQINMDLTDQKNQKALELNFPHDFVYNLGHFYKQKSCQISKLIHQNKSIEQFDRKSLRIIAQKSRKIERLLKFLSDIAHMDVSQSVCEVYPRWEAGPEFVKKNGQRRNMTTTIRWLDHRDPFFKDPRLNYIVNPGFHFESNNDEGIVIDIETLVDDLGYSLNDKEVKLIYRTNETTCIPVRAVVAHMPEKDRFHAVTTLGFGERIRSCSYHCKENRRFYQCRAQFDQSFQDDQVKPVFEQKSNFDQDNIIYDFRVIQDNIIEIYADSQYSLTQTGWHRWVRDHFSHLYGDFKLIIDPLWEVPSELLEDVPCNVGTVYTYSAHAVRALGEYLDSGFIQSTNIPCRINAFGYEDKIQFSRQTQTLIQWFKKAGIVLFGSLFFLFLFTHIMITIRNKASEIAIFQAMGGTFFSLLLIYNSQLFFLLIPAVFFAFLLVALVSPLFRLLFTDLVIKSLWNTVDEQVEPIAAITYDNYVQAGQAVLDANQWVGLFCLAIMLFTVSLMIIYVRFSRNYGVSKILKER